MDPSEIVKTSEFQVYERSLYKVRAAHDAGFKAANTSSSQHSFRKAELKSWHGLQMPERKPAPNGTLDPRLVRDSEHMHTANECQKMLDARLACSS